MVKERNSGITFAGDQVTILGEEIKVGDKAPNFVGVKPDMTEYSLADAGDKVKIISVVPSMDTPVCELQTINFNEMASKLDNVQIITVSVDLPFAQQRFCGAKGIDDIVTISDHRDLDFGLKYGFVIKGLRLLARGIIVLDKDNTVRYVEYVPEVTTHPDYEMAVEEAKKLI